MSQRGIVQIIADVQQLNEQQRESLQHLKRLHREIHEGVRWSNATIRQQGEIIQRQHVELRTLYGRIEAHEKRQSELRLYVQDAA